MTTQDEMSQEDIQQTMRAMQAEIEALRAQQQSNVGTAPALNMGPNPGSPAIGFSNPEMKSLPWMFYKKPATSPEAGWVVAAPGGRDVNGNAAVTTFAEYVDAGFTPLSKYGSVGKPNGNADVILAQLVARGGAKEFPLAQILELKWHVRPPFPGAVFPELEKANGNWLTMTCEACGVTYDGIPSDHVRLTQALLAHLNGVHKYSHREATEALKSIGVEATPFREGARTKKKALAD